MQDQIKYTLEQAHCVRPKYIFFHTFVLAGISHFNNDDFSEKAF